jgi:bloom syndrome protein
LQVEVTPGPIRKKAKPKRTAAEYPSTNISSPIRAPPKRKIQEYAYDDTGRATKSDSRPQRTSKRDNYKADKYVVADDDESDEDFEPIRVARPLTSSKSRPLGRPITVDERVAGLDEFQKDVLDDFANGAKTLAKKIQLEKSLRNQPFSDTIIREMGLDLPSNEEEMLLIPGINPDMVKYYGKRFLRLVERARAVYGNNAPQPRNQASKRRIVRPPEEEDEEDAVLDPNHRNVIDLCSPAGSDEEDKFPAPEMDEGSDVYSDEEEESDDEDAPRRVSHHFTTAPTDSRVEEFNRRFSQLEAQQQSQAPSKGREASTKPALPPARKLPWAKKGGYRKRSSSNFGKYPGVSKKGATKKAASKKAASGAGAAKRLSTGGGSGGARRGGGGAGGTANGWSSIMAMPT